MDKNKNYMKYDRQHKISSTNEEEPKNEYDPFDDIADRLNYCRLNYYKLYKKDFKVASIRLRQGLTGIVQIALKVKKDALNYRKEIEERERLAKEEAKNEGIL